MQEIKVTSGTSIAQLTTSGKVKYITVTSNYFSSLEKPNSHVCMKISVCINAHIAHTYIYIKIYIYTDVLHTSNVAFIIIFLRTVVLFNGNCRLNCNKEEHLSSLKWHGQPP